MNDSDCEIKTGPSSRSRQWRVASARVGFVAFAACLCAGGPGCTGSHRPENGRRGTGGLHSSAVISGRVADAMGRPLAGVVIRTEPESLTTATDADGIYRLRLRSDWSGILLPMRRCRVFEPSSRRFNAGADDASSFDFVALPDRQTPGCNTAPIAQACGAIVVDCAEGDRTVDVALDGRASVDRDGVIAKYEWRMGDVVVARGATARLPLPVGVHRLSLRVVDDGGAFGETTVGVTVRGRTSENRIYVSAQRERGSDMNPGTEELPIRTIGRAVQIARPGDTIILTAGTYVESDIRFARSGEPNAPITIEGREGDEVILTSGSTARWIFDFTPKSARSKPEFGYYVFRRFKAFGSGHVWRFAFPGGPGLPKPHHITIEDVEAWECASVLAARHGGVSDVTIRRCDFHDCNGTEGSLDFSNNVDDLDTPQSGSHDILIEDCRFHDNHGNNQINGMVTQGSVYNVTIRRSRCWNNGKYGFALKGSGGFVLDRCASWGNSSAQYYLRGMVADDPRGRKGNAKNSHLLTNCIGIGPRNGGSGVVIWRENTDIRLLNCTIVAMRDEKRTKSGGPFGIGERHLPPYMACSAEFRNCVIATIDGGVMWFLQVNGLAYLQNRTFRGDHNLYFTFGDAGTTQFRLQDHRWRELADWAAYWSQGEPGGDDALKGPTATQADARSILMDPKFSFIVLDKDRVPVAREWPADFREVIDPRPMAGSPLIEGGENLSDTGMDALQVDFDGKARPKEGMWSIGAVQGS